MELYLNKYFITITNDIGETLIKDNFAGFTFEEACQKAQKELMTKINDYHFDMPKLIYPLKFSTNL